MMLIIFLAGCSATSQVHIKTPTSQPTVTLFPTVTPILPMPSPTPTLVPNFAPTTTPISPPRTPLPTLSGEKDFLDFISFTGNKDCKLPCWAGVIPGITSWDDALFSLAPTTFVAKFTTYLSTEGYFGKVNSIVWSFYSNEIIASGYVEAPLSNQLLVKLMSMEIEGSSPATGNTPSRSLSLPQQYNLQSVLREYGVPPMIFIYSFVHDQPTPIPFQILLIYPDNHFYFKYSRNAKLNGSAIEACNSEFALELLVIDNKEKLVSIDAISNAPELNLYMPSWKPIEEALNMTPQKFYEIYSKASPGCMVSPIKIWLP